jgi:hypothetical protein
MDADDFEKKIDAITSQCASAPTWGLNGRALILQAAELLQQRDALKLGAGGNRC